MALVIRFVSNLKAAAGQSRSVEWDASPVPPVVLEPGEVRRAEEYYFRLATEEVKKFTKPSSYKHCSEEKDGILFFTGRLLESSEVTVIFQKTGEEQVLGQPIWRIGRVVEAEVSEADQLVRAVLIEYKNAQESVFRTTRRAARQVAVLHSEDDLEMVEELSLAAKMANRMVAGQSLYLDQQEAVLQDVRRCPGCWPPGMCLRHGLYFVARPYMAAEPINLVEEEECLSIGCQKLGVHEDP